ncbi:MAG: VOC family protein [Geodermatophilaceae bacterium]|nr:VOC family protein [Geodermatophilaceae bacterium]
MTTPFQLTVDYAGPDYGAQVTFWALALGYVPAPAPEGSATWTEYYLKVGVPEQELAEGDGCDRLVDPAGVGPPIWFQPVPEGKTVQNRLHLDLLVGGGRTVPLAERRRRVEEKVAPLLAAGATVTTTLDDVANDYFAVVLQDPSGNEFCVV